MSRWLKTAVLTLVTVLFGFLLISTPVFADPITTPDPDSSETDTETTDETEQPSCYSEVGGIGWLICPGTGFLANIIDGAYGIIEQLIRVDPLPNDPESPIYIVWSYIKNTTNLVFVIFLLVIVYSQLTGFGINNYGIKRTLPRLIIAAIAINLSFIICTLLVDISNIIGGSILGIFDNILNDAMLNSKISEVASTTSVASLVATILGVGTVGAITAFTFTGGIAGVLWALIPIVLSGAIAIISAVITMAARQALIILLAMVSPLAIVCYLLPNTEKWYSRWKQLLLSMIIFYPMFSILYGASRLAGMVVITSANSWLTVVLGIAIEVLPLFFSIPLLRMSNTMLGRVGTTLNGATRPFMGIIGRYSGDHRALARSRQLSGTGRFASMPHNRLARYLEQRRMNREVDIKEAAINNDDTYRTHARTRGYFNASGKLNRRGINHYEAEMRRLRNSADNKQYEAVFDEGFEDTDSRISSRDRRRMSGINQGYSQAILNDTIANAYSTSVKFKNLENRSQMIQDGMKDQNSRIYSNVMSSFNATDTQGRQRAVSAVLSDAINAKARADKEAKDNYSTLYNSFDPGKALGQELANAIDNKDYNSMVAALQTMAVRGDHDQIGAILRDKSSSLYGDSAANKIMQKELRDSLIRMKSDDANLWAYAKANMIRSGMHGNGTEIASFIDYSSFMSGHTVDGDVNESAISKTLSDNIIQGITDSGIAKGQDRTVFNDILDMQRQGVITQQNGKLSTKFSIKQLRSAATSGAMDGDQLAALNNLLTGGIQKHGANDAWIQSNRDAITANIVDFLSGLSASQLASTKTATIDSLNKALLALDTTDIRQINGHRIAGKLCDALLDQSAALCRPNAVSDRNKMNAAVRDMLGITENGSTTRHNGGTQTAIRI